MDELVKRIDKAIGGHLMWKAKLRKTIETQTIDVTVDSIRSDRNCHFGEWLYSSFFDDRKLKTGHYDKVVKLHAEFHQATADIVAMAIKGRTKDALEMMERNGKFADVSAKLTLAMMDWKKAVA